MFTVRTALPHIEPSSSAVYFSPSLKCIAIATDVINMLQMKVRFLPVINRFLLIFVFQWNGEKHQVSGRAVKIRFVNNIYLPIVYTERHWRYPIRHRLRHAFTITPFHRSSHRMIRGWFAYGIWSPTGKHSNLQPKYQFRLVLVLTRLVDIVICKYKRLLYIQNMHTA